MIGYIRVVRNNSQFTDIFLYFISGESDCDCCIQLLWLNPNGYFIVSERKRIVSCVDYFKCRNFQSFCSDIFKFNRVFNTFAKFDLSEIDGIGNNHVRTLLDFLAAVTCHAHAEEFAVSRVGPYFNSAFVH